MTIAVKRHRQDSNAAERLVRQEIDRLGPMTFAKFMDLALYHPRYGYYNQRAPQRGRSGDYFTSLQVSTLFAEILAEAVIEFRDALGCEQFSLVELGSGSGELLEGVLTALSKRNKLKGMRVWAVERSAVARELLYKRLSRFPKCIVLPNLEELEWSGNLEGCIVSNELFDALPFHRFRLTLNGWKEIVIGSEQNKLVETERPVPDPAALAGLIPEQPEIEAGYEMETRPEASRYLQQAALALTRGYIMTFDYGYPRAQLYAPNRNRGTWLCYHKHKANQEPLERIGQQDITAHVDFTQLALAGKPIGCEPLLYCSQSVFLSYVGKELIENRLKSLKDERAFSQLGSIQQLIHPSAMGENFWMLLHGIQAAMPPRFEEIPSRLARLVPTQPG